MYYRMMSSLVLWSLTFVLIIPSALAQNNLTDHRQKTMDERLNCFSKHASQKGIDWDEVCSNGYNSQEDDARDIVVANSLDEMVERLHAAADEMLQETHEDQIPAANVDEVYRKHDVLFDTDRSVDDVVRQEGIETDYAASDETQDPLDEEVLEDSDQSQDETGVYQKSEYKSPVHNSNKRRSYELYDEPELMTDNAKGTSLINFKKHTFDVGYEKYYYEYKEDVVSVLLKGWWDTFSAAYTYRPAEGDLLNFDWMNHYRLEGRTGFADLDYSSADTGTDDNIPNYMFETRALIGRDFYPVDDIVITPYTGFGYRFLVDDGGNRLTTTGHFGYDRTSHYLYVPIGFDFHRQVSRDWRMVANGEYDIFLSGWQKSYLGDGGVLGYYDTRNDQKHGFGVRGSVKMIRTTSLVDFSVEPFVRFWHIEDSEPANAGVIDIYEPDNTTVEGGIRAGLQF